MWSCIANSHAAASSILSNIERSLLHCAANLHSVMLTASPRSLKASKPVVESSGGLAMLGTWVDGHRRGIGILLTALACLNAWSAYKAFWQSPILAFANLLGAVTLLLGAAPL